MPTNSIVLSGSVGGLGFPTSRLTRDTDGIIGQDLTLPIAYAGTLTTRTDNNTGVITSADHTILDADVVDVYWDGGRRYGMTADVTGTAVTIDGGAGDNLPAQSTAMTVVKQVVVDSDFNADLAAVMAMHATARAHVSVFDGSDVLQLSVDLVANETWHWLDGGDQANPLDGITVGKIAVSQALTVTAARFRFGIGYDSTT